MAAATDGKIYAIGGQLTAEGGERAGYVDTVYELDPAIGQWVAKAPMPTARSAGVAVVLDGKIYGRRPPAARPRLRGQSRDGPPNGRTSCRSGAPHPTGSALMR